MGVPRKNKTIITGSVVSVAPAAMALPAKSRLTGSHIAHIFSLVIVLFSLGLAFYFHSEYKRVIAVRDPSSELREITDKVGAFLELPTDEAPTLATVTDKSKLGAGAFFSMAEDGDRILVYQKNRKAIIYRPSTGKLVNVAVLDAPAPETTTTPVQEPVPVPEEPAVVPEETVPPVSPDDVMLSSAIVALYNGSKTVGVTNQTETDLTAAFQNLDISIKEKASRQDYDGLTIIDLSGNNGPLAAKIAETFGGTVAETLPTGEITPEADILIIVGNKSVTTSESPIRL